MTKKQTLKGLAVGALMALASTSTVTQAADPIRIPVLNWSSRGFRDVCAAGVVHMAAGFFALGVLVNLGPRQGRFNADGSTNEVAGHSGPMAAAGLMVIRVGCEP